MAEEGGLVQTLELEDKKAIMEQLLDSALDLVADQNGNHVIQKCVECIKPTSHIAPLIDVRLSSAFCLSRRRAA